MCVSLNTHLATTVGILSVMQMLSRGFTVVWGTCSIVASLSKQVLYDQWHTYSLLRTADQVLADVIHPIQGSYVWSLITQITSITPQEDANGSCSLSKWNNGCLNDDY